MKLINQNAEVLTGGYTLSSLKPCDLSNCTKREIRAYFDNSYDLNESLFTGIKEEAFYKCPDRLRLPLIFYYGHTACVYMNKLVLGGLVKPADRVNLEYEALFETGVDEMSWDDVENYRLGGKYEWPRVAQVADYRRKVRQLVHRVIEETALETPVTMESPWWALFMGMEHERIHLETSSVLIRQLPLELVRRPPGWTYGPLEHDEEGDVLSNKFVKVTQRSVTLGKPFDFPSYGWDNEYGSVECSVPAFEASQFKVTNCEYLEFVKAGGYENPTYWSDEGWNWVQFRQSKHPTFWVCCKGCRSGCGAELASYSHCNISIPKSEAHMTNGQNSYCNGHSNVDGNGHQGWDEGGGKTAESSEYMFRCVFDVIDMPWTWPVEVNYHEAKAFCAWKGPEYRLPIEAEHHVMRGEQQSLAIGTTCDIIYKDKVEANLNLRYGSSTPVNMYPPTDLGFYDVFGNIWEWVEDHFNGLPGFQTNYLYDDFSTPCFDGRHTLIMGGSWISTGDQASRFARYAFRRHFFQHLGFRVARTVGAPKDGTKIKLPVRYVADSVYVSGAGVQDNPICLDLKKIDCVWTRTTNTQYLQDTNDMLAVAVMSEYGGNDNLAVSLANTSRAVAAKYNVNTRRALNLGCAAGRTTFELTSAFQQVLGCDVSARVVDVCQTLKDTGRFQMDIGSHKFNAKLDCSVDTSKAVFKQLTWLPNEIGSYDFILVTVLERVQNIKAWTVRLSEVLNKGGILVVVFYHSEEVDNFINLVSNKFKILETIPKKFVQRDVTKTAAITVWNHI